MFRSSAERLDAINIGLMLLSCVVAVIVPLEMFLFSYAVLGPLHYLTEISWLHDRKYYLKGRYDALLLLIIGLIASVANFAITGFLELEFPQDIIVWLTYIAIFSTAILLFVKNKWLRIAGILLIALTSQLSSHFKLLFGVFLPTLIHVYIFTALFMLYGASKSKSRLGFLSVAVLLACPFLLFFCLPDVHPFESSATVQQMYIGRKGTGFFSVSYVTLNSFFGVTPAPGSNPMQFWIQQVFHSRTGILLLRIIAFAYTYHYLNWFSKTSIIQWHKVPKGRFALVILFWLASVGIYLYDYDAGLMWLFFLSYLHVVLEFPLNFTSVMGLGRYCRERFFKPSPARA